MAYLLVMLINELRLSPWEIPDKYSSLDQLEYMLQLVQTTIAKGSGVLTQTEGDALVKTISAKIRRVKQQQ